MNILQSELINSGFNEFDLKDNQLTFFDDDHVFIKKILNYDEDVEKIVNLKFFFNLKLDDPENDKRFKKHFINRFFNNRPCYQTLEAFASQVVYIFLNNIDFLNEYYQNIDKYFQGKTESEDTGNTETISDNRTATATLPQSEVNINVDNTILDYADDNTIMRSKDVNIQDNKNDSKKFDINTLLDSRNILENVFNQFEEHCFLKTW